MAPSTSDQPAASASAPARSIPQQPGSRPSSGHQALSTSPVEMKTLTPSTIDPSAQSAANPSSLEPSALQPPNAPPLQSAATPTAPAAPAASSKPADLTRSETEAIGPSTDTPAANPDNSNGPVVVIMLLLTTGARHPYKIDERYLKKRSMIVENMDPYNISVYNLKELIWRDWRDEWEPRPTTPTSIRLIHFGRMLDDKSPLRDCRFSNEAPNVVHMTIKPQEVVDEEDAKTGGAKKDGDEEAHAGCRCVIL
ncbi:ubiquitin-related domain-containing protein [Massariosphaeria phaeospora]|uniref:Ubiquitin-related domain-containing protein n=1 Tax=Massariosphaeria phaeospora TaxID=100035 RepID=A0A7C8M448_9PLEO|nr:ubiquitin-related domain-containing protein [Massariosphaeria phaeospora]